MTRDKITFSKKRRRVKASHVLILLLLILILAFIFFRLYTKKKLKSRIDSIRAAGYPVTLEELDKWYCIPGNAENSAYIVLDAIEYYHQNPNDFEILPFIGEAEIPKRNEPLSEDVMKHASQFLDDNKKCLEILYKTADLEYGRYPINLNDGFDTFLPHLNHIYTSMKLLQLDAFYHADCNEPELVINSIETSLGVCRSLSMEPLIVSRYSHSSIQYRIYQTLEHIMNRIEFQEEELLQLQELFKESNEFSGMVRGFIGARCSILDVIKNIAIFDGESLGVDLPPVPVLEACEVLGLVDREAILYLDLKQEYLKVFDLPLHERQNASRAVDDKSEKISKRCFLIHKLIHNLDNIVKIDLRNTAVFRNTQIALAVQRYRLKNNELPDSLSNLVPEYIESVPLDPFDGKEMRYKKLEKGFAVYSIGEDLVDDGGKERQKNNTRKSSDSYDITFIVEK